MKIGETIVIMTLLGTVSPSSKLLKVPRIYNALITSDENIQPSQAYPALSPVIQPIQYPLPGYITTGLYQAFLPVPVNSLPPPPGGRSFSYAVKQDYFSYNYFENGLPLPLEVPKIPEVRPFDQSALFSPADTQPLPKEILSPSDESRIDAGKPSQYPYRYDAQFNGFQDNKKNKLSSSYPRQGTNQFAVQNEQIPKQTIARAHKNHQFPEPYPSPTYDEDSSTEKEGSSTPEKDQTYEVDSNLPVDNSVKNNRPKDPSIVDIPPPPLPIRIKPKSKKDPAEYPPPPGTYIL